MYSLNSQADILVETVKEKVEMNALEARNAGGLRIIWAIALKDIADSFKNKTILMTLFSATLLMVMYRTMPALTSGDDPPSLALYDAGQSRLVAELEDDAQIDLRRADSQADMERTLGRENTAVLGLVLPVDFDQVVASGAQAELKGYVDHWVSDADANETSSFFEQRLTTIAGTPIHISLERETVFTQPDGWQPYNLALAMVVLLTMFGLAITPNLMFEEKQTKTLNALLVSPAGAGHVVASKGITSLFYCLVAGAIVLAFNASLVVHWQAVILATLCGSLFTIALGLLLGSIFESRQQISALTFLLFQPLLLPVGLSVITDLFPQTVNTVLSWIPTVALADVFRLSAQSSAPLSLYLSKLAFVAGSGLLILAAVAWVVRRSDMS
jgi:ABC-2 type transport system permease protein